MNSNKKHYAFLSIYLLLSSLLFAKNKPYYNVLEYCAVADRKTLNTKAIQKEIDVCSLKGGRTVEFSVDVYPNGTLAIKDNVNYRISFQTFLG